MVKVFNSLCGILLLFFHDTQVKTYGHIAIGVPDAYAACEKIRAAGGNVTREAGPVKGGSTVIAFVTDPDGYKVELIQRPDDQGAGTGLR